MRWLPLRFLEESLIKDSCAKRTGRLSENLIKGIIGSYLLS